MLGQNRMYAGTVGGWDLLLYMTANPYYHLFLYLPFFLLYCNEICKTDMRHYIAIRLESRLIWLFSKIVVLIVVGTWYVLVYLLIWLIGSFALRGYDATWMLNYEFGYPLYIKPIEAFVSVAVRHFLSVWLISMIYLTTIGYSNKNHTTKAFVVCFSLLFFNKIINGHFIMQWLPVLYFSSDYVNLIQKNQNAGEFIMQYNGGLLAFIIGLITLLSLTSRKIKFAE